MDLRKEQEERRKLRLLECREDPGYEDLGPLPSERVSTGDCSLYETNYPFVFFLLFYFGDENSPVVVKG